MFTIENTEGYTATDIALLNTAAALLKERNPGMEDDAADDIVNDNWQGDGDSIESLTKLHWTQKPAGVITVGDKPASRQEAEKAFLGWAKGKDSDAELLALCPNGAPIILGDLFYVLEEGLSALPGRDAYRAVLARAGVRFDAAA